jgi:hypothetical protein
VACGCDHMGPGAGGRLLLGGLVYAAGTAPASNGEQRLLCLHHANGPQEPVYGRSDPEQTVNIIYSFHKLNINGTL